MLFQGDRCVTNRSGLRAEALAAPSNSESDAAELSEFEAQLKPWRPSINPQGLRHKALSAFGTPET